MISSQDESCNKAENCCHHFFIVSYSLSSSLLPRSPSLSLSLLPPPPSLLPLPIVRSTVAECHQSCNNPPRLRDQPGLPNQVSFTYLKLHLISFLRTPPLRSQTSTKATLLLSVGGWGTPQNVSIIFPSNYAMLACLLLFLPNCHLLCSNYAHL